jgi:Serine/Threonine/Tyrosine Kinase found in polyvalent proteins
MNPKKKPNLKRKNESQPTSSRSVLRQPSRLPCPTPPNLSRWATELRRLATMAGADAGTEPPNAAVRGVIEEYTLSDLVTQGHLPLFPWPKEASAHGYEHVVLPCDNDRRLLKFTQNEKGIPHGFMAGLADIINGQAKAVPSHAAPSDYLERWDLANIVFGLDVRLEGVSLRPDETFGLVVSQALIVGEESTMNEIVAYLKELDFQFTDASYRSWYRAADGVMLADVKPDNFRTDVVGQVHAIDVVVGKNNLQ